MQIKFPFNSTKPIAGEATIDIDKPLAEVFSFVGEQFFDNYPKWAVEIVDFEALDGKSVFIGARARQVRKDSDTPIESVFAITEYQPKVKLIFKGLSEPYKHSYLMEGNEKIPPTRLTFRFELLDLDIFMRPFEKLIRYAIEEGAENTVENIKKLIAAECN
ncbi:MAG: hypothetical protein PHH11_13720 [Methylomonas sp.]|nr:hypothetical protein [Methylomonas sp.]